MSEKDINKKRDWIKNAIIVFLVIMLILTFFSNTIMTFSLPEVATQYTQNGTITEKVRGTGTVVAADPYDMKADESRVIASVAVKVGDHVERGDVIYKLEDKESAELLKAREDLEVLNVNYMKGLFGSNVSAEAVEKINNGVPDDYEAMLAQIEDLQKKIDSAEAVVKQCDANLAEATKNQSIATNNLSNGIGLTDTYEYELQKTYADYAVTDSKEGFENWKTNILLEKKEELAREKAAGHDTFELQLVIDRITAYTYNNNEGQYTAESNATCCLRNAVQALSDVQHANKQQTNFYTALFGNYVAMATADQTAAKQRLTDLQNEQKTLQADLTAMIEIPKISLDIEQKKEEIEKLEAKSMGAAIVAPVTGTVTTLSYVSGETTKPDASMAVVQPDGKGFNLSFSVTNEQAKRVRVGDAGEFQNAWYYEDATAVLDSIMPDSENLGKKQILTFTLNGSNIHAGETITLSVGSKSADYDVVVPNASIKQDSNGKFILKVESKSSPLGNRYYARRVDITPLASDDNNTAISGDIGAWEYVVTTSSKPVEAGKQVRLSE